MNPTFSRRITALRLLGMFFLLAIVGQPVQAATQTPPPGHVEALLYSTMPSTAAHRPEMAMDGDPNTYFRSAYGMDDGDDFRILLGRPIPVRSIRITTGNADNEDLLTDGFVETSPDGTTFSKAGDFNSAGVCAVALRNAPVAALRLRLNRRRGLPALVVREITINSPVKVSHVALGPGRGFYDISRDPSLAVWAQTAEKQMESFWLDTAALLYSDRFITPNAVNVVYRTGPGVTGIAATGGGVMTVNTKWCHEHPDDTGLTVHETAHVIQAYSAYNPVWLVEGIADYIRWVKFEPEHFHPRINVQRATYHDSYQTTATFLAWCELHYDSALVTKLSRAVRFGAYKNDLFRQYCGKDVDALWSEFVAAYQADPVHIITPPVAAADRPRTLPTVTAGPGQSVDLSSAFNMLGISRDGATFPETGGFDAGGAAFSAELLGATPAWKNVRFTLGPPDAANVVSCRGQVVPLPAGSYSSLWLLGAAVEGNQRGQVFTITYTDGTTDQLAQNFSDWYQPQSFPGEGRALKMAYRNMANGARDARTFYVYGYGFPLNASKTIKSITLPDNEYVKLLAITLAN